MIEPGADLDKMWLVLCVDMAVPNQERHVCQVAGQLGLPLSHRLPDLIDGDKFNPSNLSIPNPRNNILT